MVDTLAIVILPIESADMEFPEFSDNNRFLTLRAFGGPSVGYVFQISPNLDKWTFAATSADSARALETTVPLVENEMEMFYRFAYCVTAEGN